MKMKMSNDRITMTNTDWSEANVWFSLFPTHSLNHEWVILVYTLKKKYKIKSRWLPHDYSFDFFLSCWWELFWKLINKIKWLHILTHINESNNFFSLFFFRFLLSIATVLSHLSCLCFSLNMKRKTGFTAYNFDFF
jgi:hypothetical protein